jgi:cysteine desulfurase
MLKLPVYLDYNATTPCDPVVLDTMMPYFNRHFGNAASRSHSYGWQAAEAVDLAREQVAQLINAEPNEIIFTSGATEACNLALKGVFETYSFKGNHIITCNIEHKAVLDSCKHLEKLGADVTYLQVKSDGTIDLDEYMNAFKAETILVAIMYANNEIGNIFPVEEMSKIARDKNVFFFSDATQAVGKIPVDVRKDGIDLLAFSSHKIYGPKGTGALYVRRKNPRVKLTAQIDGGGHEKGLRSGTLNVPAIAGLGKACEICRNEMDEDAVRIGQLRDKLENALLEIDSTFVNGNKKNRLPNVSNVSFKFVEGDAFITGFNKNIAVSSGAACTSATPEPSHVLTALGLEDELVHSSIRFSLGRFTTEEEIDYTIEEIKNTINKLRELNPVLSLKK